MPTKLCLDVGHKSVSAENELAKRIYFLNAPGTCACWIKAKSIWWWRPVKVITIIGDVLYGIPHHVCPTVALYERFILLKMNYLPASGSTRPATVKSPSDTPQNMFVIDAHLDLSMNALEWNRDLTRPLAELNQREEGLPINPTAPKQLLRCPNCVKVISVW
jgi:hypothetical protein